MKGILMSTPMVQAVQREVNPKTMTRRTSGLEVVNENPDDWTLDKINGYTFFINKKDEDSNCVLEPKHQPGDILYVRETYYAWGYWSEIEGEFTKAGKPKKWFVDCTLEFGKCYHFEDSLPPMDKKVLECSWHKRPSLFMPKAAARIFLLVTDTRAERLQDITEEDAIAEGVEKYHTKAHENEWIDYEAKYEFFCATAKESFETLWNSINAKTSPWEKNDWVWVYKFQKIDKP